MIDPSSPEPPRGARASELGPWLLLALVLGLIAAIVGGSDRLPAADGPHQLAQALRMGALLREGALGEAVGHFIQLAAPHPPVGYVPLVLFATLGLPLKAIVVLGDLVWLGLLADGMQRFVRFAPSAESFTHRAAPLATIVGLSTGLSWWAADHYGYDLIAAAVVVQCLGWLVASEGLSRAPARRWFGLWLAAGFLTKYSVPLILCLPVLWACAPALWRNRRGALEAVGLWALVAVPYYIVNGDAVMAYVGNTLAPPELPGEYPQALGFLDRFGDGQRLMLVAVKDALGLPLFLVLGLGSLWNRRWLLLLAVGGGVLLLGMLNEQQSRYALPLVFVLALAGLPWRGPWATWHAALLGLLALIGLRSSAGMYLGSAAADTPAQRAMNHELDGLWTLGAWPEVVEPYQPVHSPLYAWRVDEVLAALDERVEDGQLALLMLDGPPYQANSAMFMMAAGTWGHHLDLLTLHLQLNQHGELITNDYIGPFPVQRGLTPEQLPWTGLQWAYAVASESGEGAAWSWLAHNPHTVVQRWTLPDGYVGMLLELGEVVQPDTIDDLPKVRRMRALP